MYTPCRGEKLNFWHLHLNVVNIVSQALTSLIEANYVPDACSTQIISLNPHTSPLRKTWFPPDVSIWIYAGHWGCNECGTTWRWRRPRERQEPQLTRWTEARHLLLGVGRTRGEESQNPAQWGDPRAEPLRSRGWLTEMKREALLAQQTLRLRQVRPGPLHFQQGSHIQDRFAGQEDAGWKWLSHLPSTPTRWSISP